MTTEQTAPATDTVIAAKTVEDAQRESDYLRNALLWIRRNAGWHYMGGAFEPEHMREIANLATDALNGAAINPPPTAEEIRERAAELLPFSDDSVPSAVGSPEADKGADDVRS